jgi:hypothetical protein
MRRTRVVVEPQLAQRRAQEEQHLEALRSGRREATGAQAEQVQVAAGGHCVQQRPRATAAKRDAVKREFQQPQLRRLRHGCARHACTMPAEDAVLRACTP